MASTIAHLANLVVRQDAASTSSTAQLPEDNVAVPACARGNDYDGRNGVRISAIFVILVTSIFATWFPVFASRRRGLGVSDWVFFGAKYFGSGVIIATAFIHLLAPASDALTDPCLQNNPITSYDFAEGIALMTIFAMFFIELMTMRYGKFGKGHDHDAERASDSPTYTDSATKESQAALATASTPVPDPAVGRHVVGEDHYGHSRSHVDNDDVNKNGQMAESYSAQLTALFILEFGVIFHSIFIGLTLAVAGDEFKILYIVIVFHQAFEGLGLGTRLAAVPWPKSKRWTPYILGSAYAITTPLSIAIGLGVRSTFEPNSARTLIVNGIFDSISAGILIYTGLVELMAHEFMFSPYMSKAPIKVVLSAFTIMCFGAGIMACLGKWA